MRRLASAALLAFCLFAPVALAAVTEDELKPKFLARDADLTKFKTDKVIGETTTGTVELVDPASAPAAAKTLAEAENADRQQLYQLMAARLTSENPGKPPVTVESVARENAIRLFKLAKPGEMWKTSKGEWKPK
jgi:uncharacterized protein YdbL (DUF1318 family)